MPTVSCACGTRTIDAVVGATPDANRYWRFTAPLSVLMVILGPFLFPPVPCRAEEPVAHGVAAVSLVESTERPVVSAQDRDAFDRWVDATIGKLIARGRNASALGAEERRGSIEQLTRADVDWKSFTIRGPKNYDFPKMLFYNEFYKAPLHHADPKRLVRKIRHATLEARNARPDGSIPHSSFFTNTLIESYTPDRLVSEFESFQPTGKLEITKVKSGGTSEGIWVKDEAGRSYILIFDPPFAPEMTTSAEYIGSTLLRMAGYHVPKICITRVDGTGDPMYDGRRAVATIALDDFKGGWRCEPFRDRREIRALQVFAGWINNVDQTEQNTGVTVNDQGVCRHYFIDFGASLGSFTFRPQMARLGWTRLFDPYQQFTQPLYDHGIRKVAWEAPYSVQSASVGYFTENYDPDRWQPFYRNLGFLDVTEADRTWAAQRIARFSDDQIATVVALAGFTHQSDTDHVVRTLKARRDIIVRRYLEHR